MEVETTKVQNNEISKKTIERDCERTNGRNNETAKQRKSGLQTTRRRKNERAMQDYERARRNCERAMQNNEWAEVRDYETTKGRCETTKGPCERVRF